MLFVRNLVNSAANNTHFLVRAMLSAGDTCFHQAHFVFQAVVNLTYSSTDDAYFALHATNPVSYSL